MGDGFKHLPQEIAHVPDQLQKATGIDPHEIEEWIRHSAVNTIHSIADAATETGLDTFADGLQASYDFLKDKEVRFPNLIDQINEVEVYVGLSVITLHYSGFYARAEGLCKLLKQQAQGLKLTRNTIRWIIENTGPTKISCDVDVEFLTSAFGIRGGINAPMALAVEIVDVVLEKVGVPE